MMLKRTFLSALLLLLAAMTSAALSQEGTFALTIMHTNDQHSHHDPDASGNGGEARAAAVIRQIREQVPNTLLLDAGDRFTGTLYHQQYRGLDNAELMNMMAFDGMALGNHEFDDGDGLLAAFINAVEFPVLSANVTIPEDNPLYGLIQPYSIVDVNGEQVGLIGLTTSETPFLSSPGAGIEFNSDYASVVQQYVDELTAQGINKIILITQIGYQNDVELASQVSGIDVIVGGDSHTLMSNTYSYAEVHGYPTEVSSASGEPTLVVQAGEYAQYLGRLDVEFDENGVLTDWGGDTIFLSQYITPDPEVAALIAELAVPIDELRATPIGETLVFLVGDRSICRVAECTLGNLITDAMRAETGAQIALTNGGGIRSNIPPEASVPSNLTLSDPRPITLGDVLTVLPFGNLISVFELTGEDVIAALENGVSRVGTDSGTGRFAQVSGIRYTFDANQPPGSRIISVEVLGENGEYTPIDPEEVYTIASNDFMRRGGDEYTVLAERAIDPYDFGRPLDVVVAEYIEENSPINTQLQGRIIIAGS